MLHPISATPRTARALVQCAFALLMLSGAARDASASCFLTSGGGNINFQADGTGPSFYQINVQFVSGADTGDCVYRIWGTGFVVIPDGSGAFHFSDGLFQAVRVHPRACANFGPARQGTLHIELTGANGGSQSFQYVVAQNGGQLPTADTMRQTVDPELQHPPKFLIRTKGSCAIGVRG